LTHWDDLLLLKDLAAQEETFGTAGNEPENL
jgi:hypothetical protein